MGEEGAESLIVAGGDKSKTEFLIDNFGDVLGICVMLLILSGGNGVVDIPTETAFLWSPLGVTDLIMVVALCDFGAWVGPTEFCLRGRIEMCSGEVEIMVTDLTCVKL
jgi:hypothetical protein